MKKNIQILCKVWPESFHSPLSTRQISMFTMVGNRGRGAEGGAREGGENLTEDDETTNASRRSSHDIPRC